MLKKTQLPKLKLFVKAFTCFCLQIKIEHRYPGKVSMPYLRKAFPPMKYYSICGSSFSKIFERGFVMENLVEVKNNQVVTSSRQVAESF